MDLRTFFYVYAIDLVAAFFLAVTGVLCALGKSYSLSRRGSFTEESIRKAAHIMAVPCFVGAAVIVGFISYNYNNQTIAEHSYWIPIGIFIGVTFLYEVVWRIVQKEK